MAALLFSFCGGLARDVIGHLLAAMRPRQWIKNLFVLPALVFSKNLLAWQLVADCLGAVLSFCLLSSAIYLINDLFDLERDRIHPKKRHRPIVAGKLSKSAALVSAAVLLSAGTTISFWLHFHFGIVAVCYAAINLAYSYGLKHVVIVDVIIVASGFLLRAVGGGLVIEVAISTWFILCAFMLALFLAVVKRRQELVVLQETASEHRKILQEYTLPFLDQMISMLTSATLVCYALYAMGVGEDGGRAMQWTIPFVLYGLLRYLYVVYTKSDGESPTTVVWRDRPLQITLLLWFLASAVGLYGQSLILC